MAAENTANEAQKPCQNILQKIRQLNSNFKLNGGGVEAIKKLTAIEQSPSRKSALECPSDSCGADTPSNEKRPVFSIEPAQTDSMESELFQAGAHAKSGLNDLQQVVLEKNAGDSLTLWRISENIVLIGSCWKNRSEPFSKRNNIVEMNSYLKKNFGGRFMVYSFRNSKENLFERVQNYAAPGFDLNTCLEIARTAKCWLTVKKEGVIVIELQNGVADVILLIVSAILSYNNTYTSAEYAYGHLVKNHRSIFCSSETALRYERYFDQLFSFSPAAKYPRKILSQAIITTIPSVLVGLEQRPVLKIITEKQESMVTEECYMDSNFIVFSHINLEVAGDTTINLLFENAKLQQWVFSLALNSHFYQQGLYRFNKREIRSTLGTVDLSKCLDDSFLVDLILEEDASVAVRPLFITQQNIIQDMKILTDRMMPQSFSAEKLQALLELNYNRIVAKFCAQMDFDLEESSLFINNLEKLGLQNLIYNAKPVQAPQGVEERAQEEALSIELQKPFATEENAAFCPSIVEVYEVKDIPFVHDRPAKKATFPRSSFRASFRRLEHNPTAEPQAFVAVRPLHWASLSCTEETIFHEIKDTNFDIDFAKFEELFCVSSKEGPERASRLKQDSVFCDARRLFLISLSLKHLELKGITPGTLAEFLEKRPETLALQDLLNLERVIPTEKELEMIEAADSAVLSSVEQSMLGFSKQLFIREAVQLLVFERRFCEEMPMLEKLLGNLLAALNRILGSGPLRTVLKMVLDLGSAINHRYAAKKRLSHGYRLESLYTFSSYMGKKPDGMLMFLIESLRRSKVGAGLVNRWFGEDEQKPVSVVMNILSDFIKKIEDGATLQHTT